MILVRGKSYFEQNRSLIQLIEAPQQKCVSWSHLESRYFSHESRTTKLVENQVSKTRPWETKAQALEENETRK